MTVVFFFFQERVEEDEPMPWPGTLAVVHSYLAHKTGLGNFLNYYWFYNMFLNNIFQFLVFLAKEEEKNKLLKRSEELKAERVELEAKAKQLSNAIMVSLVKKQLCFSCL